MDDAAKQRQEAEVARRHAEVEAAQERQRRQEREDRESSRRGTPAGDRTTRSEQQSTNQGSRFPYLDEIYDAGDRQYNFEKMTLTY